MSSRQRLVLAVVLMLAAVAQVPGDPPAPVKDRGSSKPARKDGHSDPLPPGAVARFGTTRACYIPSLAFSPDGKTLAEAGGGIYLWDVATGRRRRLFPEWRLLSGTCLAWSPDGKRLAAADTFAAELYDAASGELLQEWRPYRNKDLMPIRSVAFGPGGKMIALGGDGGLLLWTLDLCPDRRLTGHSDTVRGIAFSTDGKHLASASEDKTVRIWEVATGKEVRRLSGHEGGVRCVAWAPGGRLLASGGAEGTVCLWDAQTGKLLRVMPDDPRQAAWSVAFSPDGKLLTAGIAKAPTRVWEVATGKEVRQFPAHKYGALAVTFSPGGKTLASGSFSIILWDLTGPLPGVPRPKRPLTDRALRALWQDLRGKDAARSQQAVWALADSPEAAVPFLRERLRPRKPADEQQVAALVRDLSSARVTIRKQATKELEQLDELAIPGLRHALKPGLALELRLRIEGLLDHAARWTPDRLRETRAVQALEYAGTPGAKEVFKTAAKGFPEARLTQDAKAALRRLDRSPPLPPRSP
jgi:WD40 repeat protein